MALEKKSFVMSMFCNSTDLYKAKAEYYEEQADALQSELAETQNTVAHLERLLYEAAQKLDAKTGKYTTLADLTPDK